MSLKELGLKKIYLNLQSGAIGNLYAKEGEVNSRGLLITVINKGKLANLDDIDVYFYAKTKDGLIYEKKATPLNDGTFELIYPSNMLTAGNILAEIRLVKEESNISTRTFIITVENGLISEDVIEGTDELDLISKMLDILRSEEERQQAEILRNEQYEYLKAMIENREIGKGEPGEDGLSAYQIWLDEGNEGTEQDFLESLKGPQGPPGKDGSDATVSYDNVINALGFTPANESVIGDINAILDEINGEVI